MDCAGVAGDIVGYQVGTIDEESRDALEAHLVVCSACLKTYLALKRASDRPVVERPRPHVRARLRAEVERSFRAQDPDSNVALLARRIPLYQGLALAALAAAIALAAPSVLRRIARPDAAGAAAF